ncbi:MAG: hypothetical protein IPM12_16255 [Flavobacteriales bacterium]|nr:hypothetical protein [Flavobacteriales bacterium]
MRKLMVLSIGAMMCAIAFGQHGGFGSALYPEKLRADAEALRMAIHQAHPDPYRYLTRGELDAAFDSVIEAIREPLTADRLMARLMPAIARIGDSNLRVDLHADLKERVLRESAQIPFAVRLFGDGLYIERELKGFRSFAPGTRILSINGLSAERIVRDLGAWITVDGANETWRMHQVQEQFAWLFLLSYGPAERFLVEAESPDGSRREEVVVGLLQREIEDSRRPSGLPSLPWRSAWLPESGTQWITFTSLDPDVIKRSGQNPKAFLAAACKEANEQQAKAVVLDLRGTGGRELGVAEVILAAFAREPFRLVQNITVRATRPAALPGSVAMPEEFIASIDRNYLPPQNGSAMLRPDDPRLDPVAPAKHGFRGRVFVLCDGGTRDAAALFVMAAHRSGCALLVGDEPATNAHSFTGGRTAVVTAPNSGLRLEIPLLRYIPDGVSDAPLDRGEQPRHRAQSTAAALADGRDEVRTALLRLIRELH